MVEDIVSVFSGSTEAYQKIADYLGVSLTVAIAIISLVAIWSLVWKGIALWKSAGKKHLIWFVVLLIVNTVGILEILYIFVFSKIGLKKDKVGKTKVKKK